MSNLYGLESLLLTHLPAADENGIVDDCSVNFSDFGELVRKCLE